MCKIKEQKKIRIIGDYDIDGVNASYILLRGLRRCHANADVEIPDRMKDGYGINEHLIRYAYEEGVDTILTCDNGIAAVEQTKLAKSLGMTILITDHVRQMQSVKHAPFPRFSMRSRFHGCSGRALLSCSLRPEMAMYRHCQSRPDI